MWADKINRGSSQNYRGGISKGCVSQKGVVLKMIFRRLNDYLYKKYIEYEIKKYSFSELKNVFNIEVNSIEEYVTVVEELDIPILDVELSKRFEAERYARYRRSRNRVVVLLCGIVMLLVCVV